MTPTLEDKLIRKYPKIFAQKDLSLNKTCMCWGIECGDGWYQIIDDLCGIIQQYIDARRGEIEQIEALQVKEKYGTLRFYISNGDDIIDGMIAYAEYLSGRTCEVCGSRDGVSQTSGWIVTLCSECLAKRREE